MKTFLDLFQYLHDNKITESEARAMGVQVVIDRMSKETPFVLYVDGSLVARASPAGIVGQVMVEWLEARDEASKIKQHQMVSGLLSRFEDRDDAKVIYLH